MSTLSKLEQLLDKKASEFSEKHNLDVNMVKDAMRGVLLRVEKAVEKGEPLTQELIIAALTHWHQTQEKMYEDLLANKDGSFDKLTEQVYNKLKGE